MPLEGFHKADVRKAFRGPESIISLKARRFSLRKIPIIRF
jgi:hypothetical protein